MSRVLIKIDGVQIKPPLQADFKISEYLVTDMKRNAAGTMNGQILSKKIKLFFTYPVIMGSDLRQILKILTNAPLFHSVEFVLDGISYKKSMYVGDITKILARTGRGKGDYSTWVWKNVTFNLIER